LVTVGIEITNLAYLAVVYCEFCHLLNLLKLVFCFYYATKLQLKFFICKYLTLKDVN
jgi:hypothetical protein